MTKVYGQLFLLSSSVANLTNYFSRVHNLFWQFVRTLFEYFLRTKEVVENTVSWKKGNFYSEKKTVAYFFCSVEHDKRQGSIYKGREGFLTIIVWIISVFLWDLRGCWKRQFMKNQGNLSCEENISAWKFSYYRVWQTSGDNL